MAMCLNPSWRDRFRRFAAADLDEIPHAEERAGQEHEYHPCDDIRHEQARQRLLASNGSVHDGFCFVVEPDGSLIENRGNVRHDLFVSIELKSQGSLQNATRQWAKRGIAFLTSNLNQIKRA